MHWTKSLIDNELAGGGITQCFRIRLIMCFGTSIDVPFESEAEGNDACVE
jgi:hypothetical protein